MIGVTTIRRMLDTDGDGLRTWVASLPTSSTSCISSALTKGGFSSDAHVNGWPQESSHYADADLAALDRWVRLVARLRARGWTDEDLARLMGGNFVWVFREVREPGRTPRAGSVEGAVW